MATIAGLPINGVNGQFELIKDPIQAFNDTARFVDITRGVPIVDFLANSAQQAALGQNNRSFLANTLLPNPLLQQQDVSNLAAASQLSPQSFNLAAPTLTQALQPTNAQLFLGGGAPQQPTNGILNQPLQLQAVKKDDDDDDKKGFRPPGLAMLGFTPPGLKRGGPPGQLKKIDDDDDDDKGRGRGRGGGPPAGLFGGGGPGGPGRGRGRGRGDD